MDSNKAKSILRLYRPGVDEITEPVSEALSLVNNKPELKAWYEKHLVNEDAISGQFDSIAIPSGLKDQLIQQFNEKDDENTNTDPALSKRHSWLAPLAIAASLLLIVLSWGLFEPTEKPSFIQFQQDMIAFATQPYEMDITVEDLTLINQEFGKANWPTTYVTPEPLNTMHALGGVTQLWDDNKVSIVCLEDEAGKYIWLFVTNLTVFGEDMNAVLEPMLISEQPLLTHTAWQDQRFHYYMIAEGNIDFINSYL
ncbi:hypothetical protein C9J01_05260 [Photobacterium rosenbergii]|uniref:Uncharacterized protein n=2 Tax=Photobacterium rosenbergii TaxID=294936 RepID=A0A2T3NLK8_9GAMM|nr:hypothetical protein C9J01_05260 [Photobacterium rosenbergii]